MTNRNVRTLAGALATAALLLSVSADARAQQTGLVSGQITDQSAGQPIPDALISLVGTNRSVTSDQQGRYRFTNIPAGRIELRVVVIGYEMQRLTLTVVTGGSAVADFQLSALVVLLDELVVTATGNQRRRQVANNISTIDAVHEVDVGAVTSFSNLLSSRASGVVVSSGSGTTGAGTKVRIRGTNSLSLSNEPLIYVDGARIDNTAASFGVNSISVGGQQPSRLNDINPEEIESIEIVKGPSAATLYGTEAANGVILITTKRGRPGKTRWNLYIESGLIEDHNDYPAAFDAVDTNGNPGCALIFVTQGACEQDSIVSFNVLENAQNSPITTGNRQQIGLNVSGGTERLSYFLSGEFEREVGTLRLPDSTQAELEIDRGNLPSTLIRPNKLQRVSVRANLRSQVLDNADLTVSVGYVTSDVRLPQNDNNVLGMLPSGFFGGTSADDPWGFFEPQEVFAISAEQEVERFTGSLQGNWQPFGWLSTRGVFGLDLTNQFDHDLSPTGEVAFGNRIDGQRNANRIQVAQYTVDLGASAAARLSGRLSSRSSVGVQYFQNINTGTFAFGNQLASGTSSLNGAVVTQAFEATAENVTVGVFGEEQLALNDRLFVSGGVRLDDNNAFGEQFDVIVYPKASVSWVVSEEPFFPIDTGAVLTALRLRGAWGRTGVQPTQNAAVRFFLPIAVTDGGQDVVGVIDSSLGNVDLKPERSEELEFGFDLELLRGRLGLDLTYYHKNTEDALVSRNLAPSLGTGSRQFVNLASVRNRGFEGVLSAQILQTRDFLWNITLRGATIDNQILELGEGVEPIIFGLGGNTQRHEQGFPAGAYFQHPILGFDDANGDGIISLDEVDVGDEPAFLGTPLPKRELAIQTSVTLFNRVRLSGLLDHRGGHKLQNHTDRFRCASFLLCEEAIVPGSDLAKQAATVVAATHSSRSLAGFIEDAGFWKLREVSVTFFAPDAWRRWIRADQLSLTLAGRNLFTITDYTGVDPEVFTSQVSNFNTADFLTQPPVRYWTVRVNLTY